MNPVLDEALCELAIAALTTPHGQRGALYAEAAARLNLSLATLHRKLRERRAHIVTGRRTQRSDAGQSALTRDEALLISAYLMETTRQSGKQLGDVGEALDVLRANGLIRAERVDTSTGEVRALSVSAVARALRTYRLHPGQLRAPSPKVCLGTEHPNQVWQADPSLCVLYYLRRTAGLCAMPADEFYKNKPKNLDRIVHERVWRYVFTDHASGAFYVEYVLGAESGTNLCGTFIHALQRRGADDPFCGVPQMVMVDPGSANTGAMFKNLCAALGVAVWVNQPGQPWAKGQVEKTNDIVERKFEHRLKFHAVPDLAGLNAAAWAWMRQFSARARHSRHQLTRYQAWMTITPEQLRLAPAAEVCAQLATSTPQTRVVNSLLRVSFRGHDYDVSGVPGVIVGDKLTLARNAFGGPDGAQALVTGADGRCTWYVLEALPAGRYGFKGAVPVGTFRRHADTPADTHRKEIERLVMGVETDAEAVAARKARELPFNGELDPYKSIREAPALAHLPRAGQPAVVEAPTVVHAAPRTEPVPIRHELPPLSHFAAAARLKPLVEAAGTVWCAEHYQRTAERWPQGLPVEALETWAAELARPAPVTLRVVGA